MPTVRLPVSLPKPAASQEPPRQQAGFACDGVGTTSRKFPAGVKSQAKVIEGVLVANDMFVVVGLPESRDPFG